MMLVEQNSYVGGATVQVTYTNQDGVAGRVTPIVTLNSVTVAGNIATSHPTQVGASGIYLPLQSGDSGVAYPTQIEVFNGDVGVLCIALVKPLATVALYEIGTPSDWDMWDTLGYLPEIRDDAYLNLILKPAGSASGATLWGNIQTVWK
jgi:hypothetical protein